MELSKLREVLSDLEDETNVVADVLLLRVVALVTCPDIYFLRALGGIEVVQVYVTVKRPAQRVNPFAAQHTEAAGLISFFVQAKVNRWPLKAVQGPDAGLDLLPSRLGRFLRVLSVAILVVYGHVKNFDFHAITSRSNPTPPLRF